MSNMIYKRKMEMDTMLQHLRYELEERNELIVGAALIY